MAFKGKHNPMAVKLGQHCYSYFTFKYGRYKKVVEFPAYHKTHILGAPKEAGKKMKNGNIKYKAMGKPKRKKWSIEKASYILGLRGELEVLNKLKNKGKKDDLADVVCQLQAAKVLMYIDQLI